MNKHIVNDGEKPFHSNGYARVANGNNFGSTSYISFSKRKQIEDNRRLIYGYNRSAIGSISNFSLRPISNDKKDTNQFKTNGINNKLQQFNSVRTQIPRPPLRKYNPYS
ncbi:MAG TPA: hypothetical protein PLO25_01710 [Candidatus Saccharibacteria bacterium]|nr:hypothetical protein [Candidatus Saccharibacteria bacterium]